MSHVQLQVRPRRVRCHGSDTPPPFRFAAVQEAAVAQPSLTRRVALVPLRSIALIGCLVGRVIDLATFLVALTVWCALHLALWSYSFGMGPAASCFDLSCPGWINERVLLICSGLALITFVAARILRRLGHTATSRVLLLLVTFDVAAVLLLGIDALI